MTVRTAELLMAVVLALLSIGLMWKSTELSIGWVRGTGPGGGAWPFWLAAGMLITSVVTIVRWFMRITPESRSEEPFMSRTAIRVVGVAAVALLFLLAATHLIGMYFSMLLFLIFFVRFVGGHAWTTTLALAIGMPVAMFCMFEWALTTPLPKGYAEPLFYPIYELIY